MQQGNHTIPDHEREFDIDLPCLRHHANEAAIVDLICKQASEMDSLLDGDLTLLARVYSALGVAIFTSEEKDGTLSDEVAAAANLTTMLDQFDVDTEDPALATFVRLPKSARDIEKEMRFS
ncbi:hypothetical protein ACOI1H_23850, partial [Loktanella sp. DJP18]|uniref:hypothetical protein n=1 Tax=Loktanella sp. DJP18 TaxID=3409788 RepID=UPI003BB745AD